MANVNVTSNAWTEISITSGTVQNISATADIELSAEQTDNSGVVLKPSEIYQWDNETIYARAVTEATGALRVVNFKRATGGGGGYVLPVASSSTLGGVKVGSGLSINASGVLSAENNYSTEEQRIGTWIDGKPLYQKTYNVFIGSNGDWTVDTNLDSTNYKVIDTHGYGHGNSTSYPIPYANNTFTVSCNLAITTGILNINAKIGDTISTTFIADYITIKYTKKTD